MIFKPVYLEDLAFEFCVSLDVALVDAVQVGVEGETQILECVIYLDFEEVHIIVDSVFFTVQLCFECFDVSLLIFKEF